MEHCSHFDLQKSYVLFLTKMVWPIVSPAGMTELGPKANGSKSWKDAEQQVDFALLMAFMMDRRAENFHGGYIILGGYADPIFRLNRLGKRLV